MPILLLFLAILSSAAYAASPSFAECFTVMDGLPFKMILFEDRDESDRPTGSGHARMVNGMVDQFVAETGDLTKGRDLRENRLVITTEADHRAIEMFTALDPQQTFVRFELRTDQRSQMVKLKTPSGMLWSEFECVQAGVAESPE